MWKKCVALIVCALICGVSAQVDKDACKAESEKKTVDFHNIAAAKYPGVTMVGVLGVRNVTVTFSWCNQSVKSALCNATESVMIVEDTAVCYANFNTFIGGANFVNDNVVIQLWGTNEGIMGTLTVLCDANGVSGFAKVAGPIVNTPLYNYEMTFMTKDVC